MYRAYAFIFMILFNSFVGAQGITPVTKEEKAVCVDEIKKIFGNLDDSQILKFVKVQTALTTHRLAWAHLDNLKQSGQTELRRDKNGQTLDKFEDSMKSLVEKDIEELVRLKRTKEHERASGLFNKYAEGMSANSLRSTLAGMSPALRGAIRRQLSNGEPNLYKINAADLALLNVLAEGEKSYHHRYSQSVTGNLNVARMINSSLNGRIFQGPIKDNNGKLYSPENPKSTESTSANIQSNLDVFERVIEMKEKELNDLITGMLPSNQMACLNQRVFCDADGVSDSSLSSFLLASEEVASYLQEEVINRSRKSESFKKSLLAALHYCENWLHTDTKCLKKSFRDQYCPNCSEDTCKEEPRKKETKIEITPEPIVPGKIKIDPVDIDIDIDPPGDDEIIDPPEEPKINKSTTNNTYIDNRVFITVNQTPQQTVPNGSLPLIYVMNQEQAEAYLRTLEQRNNPNIQYIPINGLPISTFPGFNPNGGSIYPPGMNGNGQNPNGNGTTPGKDEAGKDKKSPKSWGISLTAKMDKIFNAEGEDLFTVVTIGEKKKGKNKDENVCVEWKYPADLESLNQTRHIGAALIRAARVTGSLPLKQRYAPYKKNAYKVKATLYECTKDKELGKKISSSTVEIKRAWEGGSFSCDWNPANKNLSVCLPVQRKQVPFKPFFLNGTDGNQGF